jgi:YihY family inner membrane protein
VDGAQRRTTFLGLPIGILYKYFDDQGNYLAATITYYAFIAIFPLLLLATSIFGFVLQGNPELQQEVLDSALSQFPIIGDELGRPDGMQGSTAGIIVGSLAALYGSLGLGQSIQNALNVAWAVPRAKRPNALLLRLKSLVLLFAAGLSVFALTVVTALGTQTEVFTPSVDITIRWGIRLLTVLLMGALLTGLFRLASATRHHIGRAAPGGFFVAIMWSVLQYVSGLYVSGVIAGTDGMNQTFALVLGLIGLIFAASVIGVLGMEINAVLALRLWPRSLRSIVSDSPMLTDADRRAYAGYVNSQRHKSGQKVEVSFPDPETGELHMVTDISRIGRGKKPLPQPVEDPVVETEPVAEVRAE